MTTPGFRNSLVLPRWLSERTGMEVGFSFVVSVAVMADMLMEGVMQGRADAFPGYGDPSALPLIGRNRGMVQGPAQSSVSFAAQLRGALPAWMNSGGDEQLAAELQAFIPAASGLVTVRVVTRSQRWVTLQAAGGYKLVTGIAAPGGAYTPFTYESTAVLSWDSHAVPSVASEWPDYWIVIEGALYPKETRTLSQLHTAYGTFAGWAATGFGVGHQVPRADRDAILAILYNWSALHGNIRSVIWASGTDFNPDTGPVANGYCNTWSADVSGHIKTPQRPSGDRYWQPFFSLPI